MPISSSWGLICLAIGCLAYSSFLNFSLIEKQRKFEESLAKQNQEIMDKLNTQNNRLKEELINVTAEKSKTSISILANYERGINLLNRVRANNSSSNEQMPNVTANSTGFSKVRTSRQTGESSSVYRKSLEKCSQNLLEVSKDYDILANHYNALYRLYGVSRETLNDNENDEEPP